MYTLFDRIKLFRGLLSGEEARVGPFFAFMELTRRCNMQCLGCPTHSPRVKRPPADDLGVPDISYPLAEKYLADLQAMGTRSLIFGGRGEPFLHPRLFDLVAQAKQAGFHLNLVTNGTLLDEKRIDAIMACPPDELRVSLWASTPEEYAINYPGNNPENLRRVKEGLRRLGEKKAQRGQKLPEVVLHRVITKHNCHTLETLIDLARETGVNRLSFSPLRSLRGQLTEVTLSPEEERLVCQSLGEIHRRSPGLFPQTSLDQILTRYRLGEAVWEKLPCYVGWVLISLMADGTVKSCGSCEVAMGNLHTDALPVIWNGPAFRAFRRQTLTREGLAASGDECDCGYCCFVVESAKIHQKFRWFSFLVRGRAETLPRGSGAGSIQAPSWEGDQQG